MYWRILKKDLQRNKAMNLIFLAFMILCSLLLCSSAADIVITHNAVNYFFEVSKVADQYYFASSYFEEEIDAWLTSCPYVENFAKSFYIRPNKEDIGFNGEKIAQSIAHWYLFTTADSEYSLVFDENDKVVDSVAPSEVAMSANIAKILGVQKGDSLDIRIGSEMRSLKLNTLTKDVVSGKENINYTRIFLSHQDYADLSDNNQNKMIEWSVITSDLENLRTDYNSKNIPMDSEYTRDAILTLFITEKISSFILIIAAAVMLIMALVLLQFAIRLTIKENFPQIGVMKSVGIKNSGMRRMYTIKYLTISVLAIAIGLALSWPFGDFLIAPLKKSMVMPEAHLGLGDVPAGLDIRLLCSLGTAGLTMLFCWRATQPITKIPAIQAIREGASGERFRHKGALKLRGSQIKIMFFLAGNDILAGLRSFVSLFLVLAFGMLIIILPANIASTLRSGKSLEFYGFLRADTYSESLAETSLTLLQEKTYPEVNAALGDIEQNFADKGIQVEADASILISSRIYKDDQLNGINVLGVKLMSDKPIDVTYFAGCAPQLANEIAISDVLMKKLDVQLGDTVLLGFDQEEKKYIITGQIQTMHYNSHIIIFSSLDEPDLLYAPTPHMVMINFVDRNNIPGQIKEAKEMFPEYNLITAEELTRNLFFGTIDTLNSLAVFLFFLSLIIIGLVVYLISHALLTKDKPVIGLLKSIGLTNDAIRSWQTLRIMIVSLTGMLFGIGLSFILNPLVTKMSFGAAGADKLTPQYDVLWTFILYPIFVGIGVLFGTLLASSGIHKVSLRNNTHLES